MTDLGAVTDLRHFDRAFATTNRLRTEGTDFLLAAAREAGVKRFIAQSFCGWTYGRGGEAIKTEADALDPDPPEELRRTLQAIQHLEDAVTGSATPEGIVLRYGSFYGPDTGMLSRAMIDQLRRRRVPLIGGGGGQWSFIHVDDAAVSDRCCHRARHVPARSTTSSTMTRLMSANGCPPLPPWSARGRRYACRPGLAGCLPASIWFR